MRAQVNLSLLIALGILLSVNLKINAQNNQSRYPGLSVYWQRVNSPYTPGSGAIQGGPGNDPNPGSPMYVCRSRYQGSVQPGKWVGGNCNIAYGGREIVRSSYEVAYGNATWLPYDPTRNGLYQTGTDSDGTPLFTCRVRYRGSSSNFPQIPGFPLGTDLGYQPGKLLNGSCHVPLGGQEVVQGPPFEALYVFGGYYPPPYPPSYPPPAPTPPTAPAVPYAQPGPSSVAWRSAHAPFTPGEGAIEGGPGNGPKPDAPLYICRSGYNGSLIPGKWIEGKCSIAYNGREYKMDTYDVAYGKATWAPFSGISADLVQGGYDTDGSPLYICRATHFKPGFHEVGNQPGKIVGGTCHIPYANLDITRDPPFEALYSVADQPSVGSQTPPTTSAPQGSGLEIVFQTGTDTTPGKISVKNGATGATANQDLAPHLSPEQCTAILVQAAFQAGLQIQAEAGGKGLKVFGANNSVSVTGASVAVSQF
ncbi:MAG: DUF3421 domain-containing protein [Acidobacteriaceae bacterium]|nr:DUF3421 domain-containing protein [Acidobacteriaceae bacterium]